MKDNITIYSPGNIVSVTISNNMEIVDIEIKDDIFTAEQKPLLEEMLASTINQAYEQVSETNLSQNEKASSNNSDDTSSNTGRSGFSYDSTNTNFMENFNKIKDAFGTGSYDADENVKNTIGDMMKDFKIEYKDGRPYCSMPMDMLDNAAIMNMLDMFNGGNK